MMIEANVRGYQLVKTIINLQEMKCLMYYQILFN